MNRDCRWDHDYSKLGIPLSGRAEVESAEEEVADEPNLKRSEKAKRITITMDTSLAEPKKMMLSQVTETRGERVVVYGSVHSVRTQGMGLMFITLRDGTEFLQCVLPREMSYIYEAVRLSAESFVVIYGVICTVPEGRTAPGGLELVADFLELTGAAPSAGADCVEESNLDVEMDNRHTMGSNLQEKKIHEGVGEHHGLHVEWDNAGSSPVQNNLGGEDGLQVIGDAGGEGQVGDQTLEQGFKKVLKKQRVDIQLGESDKTEQELAKQGKELMVEHEASMNIIKEEVERDIRSQLRRQDAAHSDNLQDMISVQEAELKRKHDHQLSEELSNCKSSHLQVIGDVGGEGQVGDILKDTSECVPCEVDCDIVVEDTLDHDGSEKFQSLEEQSNKTWDVSSTELISNLTFKSRRQVRDFIKLYEAKVMCKMVVESGGAGDNCTSRKIVYGCTYGYERTSTATDKRPGAHSKKKGCTAFLRFFCKPDLTCVLTSYSEDHNHENTLKMYKQDTDKIDQEEEKKWLADATSLNVKAPQIKNLMKIKFGKGFISEKHIRNMQSKLKEPNAEKEELEAFLQEIEDEGGRVDVMKDQNEMVRVLVIQTAEMRKAVKGADPDVFHLDTTFNFESSGYKMSAFMYLNDVSGRGEVAQIAFMADEGSEVYKFIFSSFKKSVQKDPPVIILDKDFNELYMIKEVFPGSTPLLCIFHVLKWMKGLIKTAKTDEDVLGFEKKKELMEAFREVLYAKSIDVCQEKKEHFKKMSEEVIIRVGNGDQAYFVNLLDYYEKNWLECEAMWMLVYRKNIRGIESNHTNNRLERFWRSCKDFLKLMSSGGMTIVRAVNITVKFAEDRLEEKYLWDQRHTMRMYDKDPDIKQEYARAALEINDRGLKKFKESVELMKTRESNMEIFTNDEGEEFVKETFKESGKTAGDNKDKLEGAHDATAAKKKEIHKLYKAGLHSCNCSWSLRAGSPCRHILLFRRSKGFSLFDLTLFNKRFAKLRNKDLNEQEKKLDSDDEETVVRVVEEEDLVLDNLLDGDQQKVLNRGDKYKMIGSVHERLLEAILRCGTSSVKQYSTELETMVENVKNNRSLFFRAEANEMKDSPAESNNEETLEESGGRFNLQFHSKMKMGKVGRPRDSKTKFKLETKKKPKLKKTVPKKMESDPVIDSASSTVICSYPANPASLRQNAIYQSDLECLRPGRFVSIDIVDFKLRLLQPNGPEGEVVWLLSNTLAQQLGGRFWEAPELKKQLEAAKLYQEEGCRIIFMPWCERGHFFSLIAVLGPQDRLYIMESIGSYGLPEGASILIEFINQVRGLHNWDPVECMVITLDGPKQKEHSNDCAFFCLESACKLIEDPEDFCQRAQENKMISLYGDEVHGRRLEMVNLVLGMGWDQRQPGGLLQFEEKLDLMALPFQVRTWWILQFLLN